MADIKQGENSGKIAPSPSNDVEHADDINNPSSSSLMMDEMEEDIRNVSYPPRAPWLGLHTTRLDHLVLNIDALSGIQ